MASVTYPHIELRPDGIPVLAGRRMKVSQIAIDATVWNLSPEAIRRQYDHLGLHLAEIHAALAYYHDHQIEINAQIEAEELLAAEHREAEGETPARRRLREQGLILRA